ncbi:tryptophan halogenase family protein [Microbulbifer sp. Q7]|uniref:tryptophan halogenase family protein n=1 Tax=Microbulbifer sp. Q7 TaxID=1785091 RepID=UPI00082E4931|nr:tryptophan halogenase family protein [Microbulbifer sp. Q7]
MQSIRNIVVIGGGTAGWLAAASLARHLCPLENQEYSVTLVESPDAPTIGVGEGTWPTMRNTLRKLGIDEFEFIRECDASFKQGTRFVNWHTADARGGETSYYHSFELPQGLWPIAPGPYWHYLQQDLKLPYAEAISPQPEACKQFLAPKSLNTPQYEAVLNYAYHLDAGKFADFLRRHATEKLGVTHLQAHVESVVLSDSGFIESIATRESDSISGDLFIDCSGFSSLLLDKTYQIPFRSVGNTLLVDKAIALQVPYADAEAPINSPTLSTAQSAGWIWEIGLQSRRGTGYVYSGNHATSDDAEKVLREYAWKTTGLTSSTAQAKEKSRFIDSLETRHLNLRLGYREKVFYKNCVGMGLSAAFLEPLEASAIFLIEASCNMLTELFPRHTGQLPLLEKKFNDVFSQRWQRVVDFIKLHYYLSRRTDGDFWHDNRDPSTLPETLKEQLEFWRHYPPSRFDMPSALEPFVRESYEFILYGMEYHADYQWHAGQLPHLSKARENFERIAKLREEIQDLLPSNRALLQQIRGNH